MYEEKTLRHRILEISNKFHLKLEMIVMPLMWIN